MKRFLLLFSVGLVGEEFAKGEPRPRSLSSFSWCIFNASLVLVDGRKKKSSHQLFRVALKRRGCGIQCQSWEPEAFKPAKINFIYIHVSLPSYHSLSPTETDVLLGGYGTLWKKAYDLAYRNPSVYSWSTKACNHQCWLSDYVKSVQNDCQCVSLHCSWQSNNPLYIRHKTELYDALHYLIHMAAHGALHSVSRWYL